VAIAYFDASAFVKLLVEEDGTDLAAELWDGCDAAVSSRLSHPEVRAALAAAQRDHRVSASGVRSAEDAWHEYWAAVRPVELTEALARHAGDLACTHALRGTDAVHVASALAVAEEGDLVMAVWDQRLAVGASAAGLAIAPALDAPGATVE
jgi:uncharacterized protein